MFPKAADAGCAGCAWNCAAPSTSTSASPLPWSSAYSSSMSDGDRDNRMTQDANDEAAWLRSAPRRAALRLAGENEIENRVDKVEMGSNLRK